MNYIKLVIAIAEPYQESLIAELSEMEFDSFEQLEDTLITYIPRQRYSIVDRERLEQLLVGFPGDEYIESEEVVADRNWNEQWEETIQPQQIGKFLVKPTWTSTTVPDHLTLLEIDPKMSFGTGYHETTRLMLRKLPDVIAEGDRVLDAGTGTGILAIAAVKLGASGVFAFDIDEWSVTNTRENILLNGVEEAVEVQKGSVELLPADAAYHVILANINRNALLEMIETFGRHLKPGGKLLLSGLLETDRGAVEAKLPDDMEAGEPLVENEWIMLPVTKKG